MNGLTKRLRKGRTFASLPNLEGRRPRKPKMIDLLPAGLNEQFDVTDDLEQKIANALKDDRLAKRVVSLLKDKHPYGTVPEMIMLDFFEQKGERYKYQAALYGGFRQGGIVLDFLVNGTGILVNGNYWHNIPGRTNDASDKLRAVGQYLDGERVERVVVVWENRLMGPNRELVMQNALQGIEMGE